MNMTQMHQRLRVELLRRIQRGTLSVSLLARQTGFTQAHLSNFMNGQRRLSLEAMDRVLAAQYLTARDLLPATHRVEDRPLDGEGCSVPIVSHAVALFEPSIRPAAVQSMFYLPAGVLASCRPRTVPLRMAWQRFVAVRVQAADAQPMEPVLRPEAIVLIDRHYNSLASYRLNRPNLFAVRHGSHLILRYVDFVADRLVLRPHNLAFPVELIELDPGESPNHLIAGRIAVIQNQL
jgi:transcriptional regulator with XRE-family HTH domain